MVGTRRVRVWHPHVPHPREYMTHHREGLGWLNAMLASRLAVVFGSVWTIWVFVVVPLVALLMPQGVQTVVFFLASAWVQLFALPLFVWVANTTGAKQDAKAEADHQALSHIATRIDMMFAREDR